MASPSAPDPVYLDHHATTPVDTRVLEAMRPYFCEDFGNASSASHAFGWRAEAAVELAREDVARAIGAAEPREIVFTSGATESDNLALQGVMQNAARAPGVPDGHLLTVATEHPAVLDTCDALEARGARVTRLPVDARGFVSPAAVADAIGADTRLVSVMAANSEIGSVAPLAEIGAITRARGVLFHCDAAQAVGKMPLDVCALGIDLLSFSAHKVYGPKGVGALYLRRGVRVAPLLFGGGHERGLRPGTLPVPLLAGFAEALRLAREAMPEERRRLTQLRDALFSHIQKEIPGVHLNGPALDESAGARLPGNLNLSFEGVRADALLPRLPELALSTGSACASAKPEPSHVLRACGFSPARVAGALRFGLGRGNTLAQMSRAASQLARAVRAERALLQ